MALFGHGCQDVTCRDDNHNRCIAVILTHSLHYTVIDINTKSVQTKTHPHQTSDQTLWSPFCGWSLQNLAKKFLAR